MKKISLFLVILITAAKCYCQSPLDTIYAGLQVKFEEWCFIKGGWTPSTQLEKKTWKRMKAAINAYNDTTANTLMYVDSIPGVLHLLFYSKYQTEQKGITSYMSNDANSIATKIYAITRLQPFLNPIKDRQQGDFKNQKKNGKDDFDN
jgi:hypothetical protein